MKSKLFGIWLLFLIFLLGSCSLPQNQTQSSNNTAAKSSAGNASPNLSIFMNPGWNLIDSTPASHARFRPGLTYSPSNSVIWCATVSDDIHSLYISNWWQKQGWQQTDTISLSIGDPILFGERLQSFVMKMQKPWKLSLCN